MLSRVDSVDRCLYIY